MGNNLGSNEQFGDIQINTKKKTYEAGEQVNGFINLNLTRPFPSNQLYLVVEGKEQTQLTKSVSENVEDISNIIIYNLSPLFFTFILNTS